MIKSGIELKTSVWSTETGKCTVTKTDGSRNFKACVQDKNGNIVEVRSGSSSDLAIKIAMRLMDECLPRSQKTQKPVGSPKSRGNK